ncbi:MAG: 2-aminoethylphosphonate--pyruvate transaminase [Chloroflexota bacterium]
MPHVNDKLLFTPGPLTTSKAVKAAMLHDLGSRDTAFSDIVLSIRRDLVKLAASQNTEAYSAIPVQGSGTFAIESVIGSVISRTDELLVIINGAYGRRMLQIAEVLGIKTHMLTYPEYDIPDTTQIENYLQTHPEVTVVGTVHCETTTGILNPIPAIGHICATHDCIYIVDAMSSFGAIPLDMDSARIHYLISSANKCIEGVPGFGFVIARTDHLASRKDTARSLSLDLYNQWKVLEATGQFRFTPPVQVILAFRQAIDELLAEGGISDRGRRYAKNNRIIREGMIQLGFRPYLSEVHQSNIITTFHYPDFPEFEFDRFYQQLSNLGMVIYPGKLTDAPCFRIGNIGRLTEDDIYALLSNIKQVLKKMRGTAHETETENNQ